MNGIQSWLILQSWQWIAQPPDWTRFVTGFSEIITIFHYLIYVNILAFLYPVG
ncbi:hypothetical protein VCHA50P415_20778 [Vibrio chagasii]|nr:hypothetical protein VCHA27O13_140088 [Vibrio chagasii]CAH6798755.1 hypothetical protein VCHA34P112_110055 [Vibrio chagasii]CAH6800874.1 hypothetical protein VCHA31O71_110078 [Vibrio chagasii]CAH6801297.1 hypothetical protein VCHA34P120_100159 [Vibrio chagasii]CAH6802758.1 hypothetical protein VCHA28FP16_110112 [Vibrio chagasii]